MTEQERWNKALKIAEKLRDRFPYAHVIPDDKGRFIIRVHAVNCSCELCKNPEII